MPDLSFIQTKDLHTICNYDIFFMLSSYDNLINACERASPRQIERHQEVIFTKKVTYHLLPLDRRDCDSVMYSQSLSATV